MESSSRLSLVERTPLPSEKPLELPYVEDIFEPSRAVFVSLRHTFKDLSSQEDALGFAICDLLRDRNAVRAIWPKGLYWIVELQTPQLAHRIIGQKIRADGKTAAIDKYRVVGEQRHRTFFASISIALAHTLEMDVIQAIACTTQGQNLTFSPQSQTQSRAKDTKWILSFDHPADMVDFRSISVVIRSASPLEEPYFASFEPVKPSPDCLVCHAASHKPVFCRHIEHVPPPVGCMVPRYSMAVPDATA